MTEQMYDQEHDNAELPIHSIFCVKICTMGGTGNLVFIVNVII